MRFVIVRKGFELETQAYYAETMQDAYKILDNEAYKDPSVEWEIFVKVE